MNMLLLQQHDINAASTLTSYGMAAMNDKLQTSSTHNNCQEWLDAHHCLEGEVVRLEDEMEGLKKKVS